MKVKVSEATNIQLDWMVWNCAGGASAYPKTVKGPAFLKLWNGNSAKYIYPTTDWSQGGPIIEREGITVQTDPTDVQPEAWSAYFRGFLFSGDGSDCFRNGPTPLIAAMRCFVASELGEEVEVPEELT